MYVLRGYECVPQRIRLVIEDEIRALLDALAWDSMIDQRGYLTWTIPSPQPDPELWQTRLILTTLTWVLSR